MCSLCLFFINLCFVLFFFLGKYCCARTQELLHASCENIRDTAEQYISKISTFLLVETLLLGSLFTVIIEAELPPNTQSEMGWLVLLYSLTSGISFMTLSSAVYLTYAVQERVLKLRRHALGGAFKAFKEHREHWTQSITKLRDFYFRLESEREHLHEAFDEDILTTKTLVNHASVAFAVGILTLASSVVTVMFAKLTLSFTTEDGETDHAWEAAYLFMGIFVVSIIILFGLVLREQQSDFLRPVILLRGDYCMVWKENKYFDDPGATAIDLQSEGGKESVLTHLIKISISFHSKDSSEHLVRVEDKTSFASVKDAGDSFTVPAYLDPKHKVAKLLNWSPNKVGMYVINYFVSDEKGNIGKASRTIIVTPSKDSADSMVVPPSSPPPKLAVLERKGSRKMSMLNVDVDMSAQRHNTPSIDFDNNDSGNFGVGPLESGERASKLFARDSFDLNAENTERFSLSNISVPGHRQTPSDVSTDKGEEIVEIR